MEFNKGDQGIVTFGNGSKSRVKVWDKIDYPSTGMCPDVIFRYEDEETHRPVVHPHIPQCFVLPIILAEEVFAKGAPLN